MTPDDEPHVEIRYRPTRIEHSDDIPTIVEIINAREGPNVELKFEWVVDYEIPQKDTEEFVGLESKKFEAFTGQRVQSAYRLGGRWSFMPRGEGPLSVGDSWMFLFAHEWMEDMKIVVESLLPDRYCVVVSSFGYEDLAINGNMWGEFVSTTFQMRQQPSWLQSACRQSRCCSAFLTTTSMILSTSVIPLRWLLPVWIVDEDKVPSFPRKEHLMHLELATSFVLSYSGAYTFYNMMAKSHLQRGTRLLSVNATGAEL